MQHKIKRLKLYSLKLFSYIFYLGYFIDSCKDKDKELSPLIKNATSAREYLRILKDKELFTPSDVIFMQFLLRETNCGSLNDKCIAYAKTQKALCFYEEPISKYFKKNYALRSLSSALEYKNTFLISLFLKPRFFKIFK